MGQRNFTTSLNNFWYMTYKTCDFTAISLVTFTRAFNCLEALAVTNLSLTLL